jgi:L-threonylcarbamoyladenylate synthase
MTARRLAADAPGAIERAARALRDGGLLAIPTETVYGLACLPTDTGLQRLVAAN